MTDDYQILRPNATKVILFSIVSIVLTIVGIIMPKENILLSWVISSLFGFVSIIFIMQLIPGSTQLTLTKEGFIMTSLFRSHFTKWSDVKVFKIDYLGRNKAVMFDYVDSHKEHEIGKIIAKTLSDSHGALPINYGLKVTELLNIMNEWKNKYSA